MTVVTYSALRRLVLGVVIVGAFVQMQRLLYAAASPLPVIDSTHVLVPLDGRMQIVDVEKAVPSADVPGDRARLSLDGHRLLVSREGQQTFLDLYAVDGVNLHLLASERVDRNLFDMVQSNFFGKPFGVVFAPAARRGPFSTYLVDEIPTGGNGPQRIILDPLFGGVAAPIMSWRFADDEQGWWCGNMFGSALPQIPIAPNAEVLGDEREYFVIGHDRTISQVNDSMRVSRTVGFHGGRVLLRGRLLPQKENRYWEYDLATQRIEENRLLNASGEEVLAITPGWDEAVMLDVVPVGQPAIPRPPDRFVVELLRVGKPPVDLCEVTAEDDIKGAAFVGDRVVLATTSELVVFRGDKVTRHPRNAVR